MENWAHSVDQCLLQCLQFAEHLIHLWSMLLRCNCFSRIQKTLVDQTSSRPPKVIMTFCWCKCGFGECFGASSHFIHWAGPHWFGIKSMFHHMSQSNWEMVHCCTEKEKTTLPNDDFFYSFDLWSAPETHILSLFTFTFFKCWTTVEWSVLSSSATSHVVGRGSASMLAFNWLL